jgi:hypothetical protein
MLRPSRRLLPPIRLDKLEAPPIAQPTHDRGPGDAADQHGEAPVFEEDLGQQFGVLQQPAGSIEEAEGIGQKVLSRAK